MGSLPAIITCTGCGNPERPSPESEEKGLSCSFCGMVLIPPRKTTESKAWSTPQKTKNEKKAALNYPESPEKRNAQFSLPDLSEEDLIEDITPPPDPPKSHPLLQNPEVDPEELAERRAAIKELSALEESASDQDEGPGRDGSDWISPRRRKHNRSRNKASWGRTGPIAIKTIATLGGLVVITVLVWVFWSMAQSQSRLAPKEASPSPGILAENDETGPSQSAFREAAMTFLKKTSPEDRLALILDPERLRDEVLSFAPTVATGRIKSVRDYGRAEMDRKVRQFLVQFEDSRFRLALAKNTPEGIKVDWEAYARSCSASLEDLLTGKVDEAVARVTTTPSLYYNWAFRDDKKWIAIDLNNPDWGEEAVTAYAPRDSTRGKILSWIASRGNDSTRLIVRIRSQDGSHTQNQFVVEEILSFGWALPEENFETHWLELREEEEKIRKTLSELSDNP